MEIIENPSEKLKEIRRDLNITQKELSELTGVTKPTIENIEQGKRKGNDETWEKILNYVDSIK